MSDMYSCDKEAIYENPHVLTEIGAGMLPETVYRA